MKTSKKPKEEPKRRPGKPPLVPGQRARSYPVTMTEADAEIARKLGNQNVSAGVRVALRRAGYNHG